MRRREGPAARCRKNWLFAGTPRGAEASALLYSLIETARATTARPIADSRIRSKTPPRTWGRLATTLPPPVFVGNTPTHVGKTIRTVGRLIPCRKHPHARGEDPILM